MTPEQQAAYYIAQSVAAYVEIEAMKAMNASRADRGLAQAYPEEAFLAVIDKYGLGHNTIIGWFRS